MKHFLGTNRFRRFPLEAKIAKTTHPNYNLRSHAKREPRLRRFSLKATTTNQVLSAQ